MWEEWGVTYGEKWGVSERKNLARLGELAHEWFSSRIWCWQHVDGREGEREKEGIGFDDYNLHAAYI